MRILIHAEMRLDYIYCLFDLTGLHEHLFLLTNICSIGVVYFKNVPELNQPL